MANQCEMPPLQGLVLRFIRYLSPPKQLENGELINALPHEHPVADTIYAVYLQNHHLPKKIRAVIDHLVAMFSAGPPWEKEWRV